MKRPKRLSIATWPTPRLELVERPDPACGACRGAGELDVPDPDGESASRELCHCYAWWAPIPIVCLPRWLYSSWRRLRPAPDSAWL